jgi:hypothetical protein
MSQRSEIDRVLAELGGACGLAGLALNEDGVAALTIGEVPVSLSYIAAPAELLLVMVEITTMAENDQATPSYLLEIALPAWLNGIMTIAMDKDGDALGYLAIPPGILDADSLQKVLGQMVETTLAIRAELDRGAHLQEASSDSVADDFEPSSHPS